MVNEFYEEYCKLRLECGFDEGHEMKLAVWEKCDRESQFSMVVQMRKGAVEYRKQMEAKKRYNERYGEVW